MAKLSRLYAAGHVDWQSQKIAGWDAQAVAKLLAGAGMPRVRSASLVACYAGRNKDGTGLTNGSANSSALQFHEELTKKHGIKTVVYARVLPMATILEGEMEQGRKLTALDDDREYSMHHRPQSKKKSSWKNGKQLEEWVVYAGSEFKGSHAEI